MAKADLLKKKIQKWEGGFSNHPNDKGGATNSGITIATFRSVYGQSKTVNDLKNMSQDQWLYVFKTKFWDKWKADDIKNQSIANLLVDWLWASGSHGIKQPQQVLNVTVDGIVGNKTISAINNYSNQKELFDKLWNKRKQFFENIVKNNPSQKVFLKGWLNRLNDFKFD